ncbi:MAG: tetratricopeptide repeat protein [Planctomycetota bacterium]|nr:MAG: tetratricopeptide repeat protein [Planctomycetota bacterium]
MEPQVKKLSNQMTTHHSPPTTHHPPPTSHYAPLIGLLLVLLTLCVYYPVRQNRFVYLDDNLYVTANPDVQVGLKLGTAVRAFTTTTAGNWHPLTMLSLELDSTLFGQNPAGYHLTNLFLHAASACLLFWPRAWVAALFALHPLHVGSVAWVAERKDVLSGLFWMLTLLAYVRYAEAPSWPRFAWVFVALALGLLAKPMLVTLPFVLLLLDYWPLGRFVLVSGEWSVVSGVEASGKSNGENSPGCASPLTTHHPPATTTVWPLLREKLPLFALAVLFSAIALLAQHREHALRTFAERPFSLRLENAAMAYVFYLGKLFWPAGLAPFYPYDPTGPSLWAVAGAVGLLLGITTLSWRERHRRPYLAVGWLWYMGTLVPVVGLVQVGNQAWADRYTYIPSIGIFMMLAWGVPQVLASLEAVGRIRNLFSTRVRGRVLIFLGVATVAACAIVAHIQAGYWQNDVRLWEHTLQVTKRNDVAHNNLGTYLANTGKLDEGMKHFAQAATINPGNDQAQVNLAKGFWLQGRRSEAVQRLRAALEVNPVNAEAHVQLGQMYLQDQPEQAMAHFQEALRLHPGEAGMLSTFAQALTARGRFEEAAACLAEAVELSPNWPSSHYQLGSVLCRLGRREEALASLQKALDLAVAASQEQLRTRIQEQIEACRRQQSSMGEG